MYAISCDLVNQKEYLYDTNVTIIPCNLLLLVIFTLKDFLSLLNPFAQPSVCVCVYGK